MSITKRKARWLNIFSGRFKIRRSQPTANDTKKVVVFDLDETMGSFADLHIIWNSLFHSKWTKIQILPTLQHEYFHKLMELFPEFLRYGVVRMLNYLSKKIRNHKCEKILIYTNNQCKYPDWLRLILTYLNRKICAEGETIFDKPVGAFKINNQIVENMRTSHMKLHSDIINCARLSPETEICFIDDTHYTDMIHSNVYYIQPPPYHHPLTIREIEMRLLNSNFMTALLKQNVVSRLYQMPQLILTKPLDISPKDVYDQMMEHIKMFFDSTTGEGWTRRQMHSYNRRFTRRSTSTCS